MRPVGGAGDETVLDASDVDAIWFRCPSSRHVDDIRLAPKPNVRRAGAATQTGLAGLAARRHVVAAAKIVLPIA